MLVDVDQDRGLRRRLTISAGRRVAVGRTVTTARRGYEDMAIRALPVPCEASIGQAFRFSCDLVQVKTVQSETAMIEVKARGKVSLGKKPAATAPTPNKTMTLQTMQGS